LKISKFADNARVIYKFSTPPIQNYPTSFFLENTAEEAPTVCFINQKNKRTTLYKTSFIKKEARGGIKLSYFLSPGTRTCYILIKLLPLILQSGQ